MKSVKTEKGTVLPLTNLKGKDYLMVAYRIQWMNEVHPNFEIKTEFLLVNEEQTIAKATVSILETVTCQDGSKFNKVVKSATATKRETKKDFSDHTEKAETAAVGRALAMLGFGTQFAVADLDEGDRLADAPVVNTKVLVAEDEKLKEVMESSAPQDTHKAPPVKKSSFRKPKTEITPELENEWAKE